MAIYLLEIDGIKGESTDSKHPGTIEVESFSWGLSNTGSASAGGGAGAGKASFQDFSFVTPVSQASPELFLACASGEHIKTATLFVRKSGGKQQDYLTIQMSDVLVSSYKEAGDTTERRSVPMDSVAINFAKIEIEFIRQNPDGGVGVPFQAGWDLRSNQKV